MIVVDVETTGTDPRYHSLVSIGAIDFENPADTFYRECYVFDGARIEEKALQINGMTEAELYDKSKPSEADILKEFIVWMRNKKDHTFAGQNVSFDVAFIIAAAERAQTNVSIAHRVVDLHSITYFHMSRRGIVPPLAHGRTDLDSDKIMEYVGIPAEPKPHVAINGAKWEAEAFSRLFNEKSMFPELNSFKIPWIK
ncbi:MAG: 3'-5' exonuclease [Patescibacteria group bacterium]